LNNRTFLLKQKVLQFVSVTIVGCFQLAIESLQCFVVHFFENTVYLLAFGLIYGEVLAVQLVVGVNTSIVSFSTGLFCYLLPR
jgi:hypothetical protein